MLLLAWDFGWGVGRVVVLLFLRMRRRVLGILGRLDSPFPDILVVPPWFDRGPLVRGHCSFVGGRSKNSTVLVEGDLVPFDRHIVCFHSRMGNFAWCFGMGSVVCGPSIRRYCRLSDEHGLLPRLVALDLGMWVVLLPS